MCLSPGRRSRRWRGRSRRSRRRRAPCHWPGGQPRGSRGAAIGATSDHAPAAGSKTSCAREGARGAGEAAGDEHLAAGEQRRRVGHARLLHRPCRGPHAGGRVEQLRGAHVHEAVESACREHLAARQQRESVTHARAGHAPRGRPRPRRRIVHLGARQVGVAVSARHEHLAAVEPLAARDLAPDRHRVCRGPRARARIESPQWRWRLALPCPPATSTLPLGRRAATCELRLSPTHGRWPRPPAPAPSRRALRIPRRARSPPRRPGVGRLHIPRSEAAVKRARSRRTARHEPKKIPQASPEDPVPRRVVKRAMVPP